jgi:hypothetical protein
LFVGGGAPERRDDIQRPGGLTVDEHRRIEVIVRVVVEHSVTIRLAPEDRAQLDVLIQMLELQLRAPRPDRPIVARVLRGLLAVGGGVLVGVLGNLASDLIAQLEIPWP